MPVADSAVAPGFCNRVHGAQQCFRALLQAMSQPGEIMSLEDMPPSESGLPPVIAAMALTLIDPDITVLLMGALDNPRARGWVSLHCGARFAVEPEKADFLLVDAEPSLPDLLRLKAGEPDYCERSATVILAVEDFSSDRQVVLSGPGIEVERDFGVAGLSPGFWRRMQANNMRYPLGVDVILCADRRLAAIARSTRISLA